MTLYLYQGPSLMGIILRMSKPQGNVVPMSRGEPRPSQQAD